MFIRLRRVYPPPAGSARDDGDTSSLAIFFQILSDSGTKESKRDDLTVLGVV